MTLKDLTVTKGTLGEGAFGKVPPPTLTLTSHLSPLTSHLSPLTHTHTHTLTSHPHLSPLTPHPHPHPNGRTSSLSQSCSLRGS